VNQQAQPERSIARYDIYETLGQGGFGTVSRAIQQPVGREVAFKIIRPDYANQSAFIQRFLDEAAIHARLEHAHIVRLYDFWRDNEGAFLIMQYIRGESLQKRLARGQLSVSEVLNIVQHIASALSFAHLRGIIHRDLKPANILLDNEGRAYLTDFGIAYDQNQQVSASPVNGMVLGSPAYMSPEQILGQELTIASDIYSLGITSYEMLEGQPPFSGAFSAIMQGHTQQPLPPLKYAHLKENVYQVLSRATHKDPSSRYADAEDFAQALQLALDPFENSRLGKTRPFELKIKRNIPNPYRGLRTFEEADSQDFCGRSSLVERLAQRLAEKDSPFVRFLAVVGPSGSGKSSLVRAGLVPQLRHDLVPGSAQWYRLNMTPGPDPYTQLATVLQTLAIDAVPNVPSILHADAEGLLKAIDILLPDRQSELFLLIDQFEEVFTLAQDHESISRFLDLIYTSIIAPHSRLRIVITLRADFYDRPLLYENFSKLMRTRSETVIPMTYAELRDAIVLPAENLKIRVETALVETMIQDVKSQPGTLPLLEYTLAELFEERNGNALTLETYQRLGGVRGAISRRAGQVYEQLSPAQQAIARQAFLRLVTLGEGTEDTRRRLLQSELLSMGGLEALAVMDHFEHARLVTSDYNTVTREPTLEVAHEALIREWPLLRLWLSENRDDLRRQRSLASYAKQWQEADYDPSYLMSGLHLESFSEWRKSTTLSLDGDEEDFLNACLSEYDRRKQALADADAREKRLAANARYRMQAIILMLILGILISFGLIQQISSERANAEQERRAAQAQRDQAQRSADESLSLSLALAALQSVQEGMPFQALSQVLRATQIDNPPALAQRVLGQIAFDGGARRTLEGHQDRVWSVAISPDARLVASGGQDSMIRLWDAQTGQMLQTLRGHDAERRVYDLAFFPDGQRLASASQDETVAIWDIRSGQIIRRWDAESGLLWALAISPNGQYILTGGQNGLLKLWNAQDGTLLHTMRGHISSIIAVAISSDGLRMASGGADRLVRLWDLASGKLEATLVGHSDVVAALAFSQDGHYLLSGAADLSILMWDINSGQIVRRFNDDQQGHTVAPIRTLSLDSVNQIIYSGAYDGHIVAWDAQSGDILKSFIAHESWVLDTSLSADGRWLASASADGIVILWDVLGRAAEVWRRHSPSSQALSLASAPNNQQVSVGHQDGTLSAHDPQTGQLLWQTSLPAPILSLAYSPDGVWLAVGLDDGQISLHSAQDGQQARALAQVGAPVWALSYHPNGELLASASGELQISGERSEVMSVSLWQVADGQRRAEQRAHRAAPQALVFSDNGQMLYSGGSDSIILAWDWQAGQMRPLGRYANATIKALALNNEGHRLAVSGQGGDIMLLDTRSGEQVLRLNDSNVTVRALSFVDDEQLLAAGGDVDAYGSSIIRMWSLPQGAVIREFSAHTALVRGLSLGKDRSTFYSLGEDGLLIRWHLDSLQTLRERLFTQADIHCIEGLEDERCTSVAYLETNTESLKPYLPLADDAYLHLAETRMPYATCQTPSPQALHAAQPIKVSTLKNLQSARLGFSVVQQPAWLHQAQKALPPGYELLLDNAQDAQAQMERLESWLREDAIDLLILATSDERSPALDELLSQARQRAIPVLLLGGTESDERVSGVIGISPYEYGCIMAQEMVVLTRGEGIFTRFHDVQIEEFSKKLEEGLLYALKNYGSIKITNAAWLIRENLVREGLRASQASSPRLDGIFVDGSWTTDQLFDLLESEPQWPRPPIVGIADLEAAERAQALGIPFVSITSEPLGALAIRTADALLKGQAIPAFTAARLRTHTNSQALKAWLAQ